MKKVTNQIFLVLSSAVILASCNTGSNTKTDAGSDSTAKATTVQKMDYPYSIDHPDYWEIGSQQNTFNALSSLKAWENKNLDECLKYFADSVQVDFDGLSKKVSKDSLRVLITPGKNTKNITIKMQDWESVISKDKKQEWVTIWYRQFGESMDGKKDSVDVINDIKMKDGKIQTLDEYRRKLH